MAEKTVRLNPEFSVTFDGCGNHWLVKTKTTENGKEYKDTYCGYHWSFAYLLQAFVKVRLPEKEGKTVKAVLSDLAEIQEETRQLALELGRVLDKQRAEIRELKKGARK